MIYEFNTNRVPDPTLPNVFRVKNYKWMSFGNDNLYPQYISELYSKSAINRTAIVSKKLNVLGEGLETVDPELQYVLNRANDEETWDEVFEKAVLDFELYDGYALNVVWNRTGEKIHSIYHIPFQDIRLGDYEEDDVIRWCYYSSNWAKFKKHKPIAYHMYDPSCAQEYPSQIYYFKTYDPNNRYYPIPSYSGGCSDIEIDIEVSTLHLSNLANGLNPSLWINFNNGSPDPEQMRDVYESIASGFSGVENTGKFFATFSDSKEMAPEVIPIESANDDYYLNLEQRITSRILTAHRITSPLLLGLYHEGGGGLGSNKNEILVAFEHFQRTVIQPNQQKMLKGFNKMLANYGYDTTLKIKPYELFKGQIEGVNV